MAPQIQLSQIKAKNVWKKKTNFLIVTIYHKITTSLITQMQQPNQLLSKIIYDPKLLNGSPHQQNDLPLLSFAMMAI